MEHSSLYKWVPINKTWQRHHAFLAYSPPTPPQALLTNVFSVEGHYVKWAFPCWWLHPEIRTCPYRNGYFCSKYFPPFYVHVLPIILPLPMVLCSKFRVLLIVKICKTRPGFKLLPLLLLVITVRKKWSCWCRYEWKSNLGLDCWGWEWGGNFGEMWQRLLQFLYPQVE